MAGVAADSPCSLACGDVLVRWAPVGKAPPAAERGALTALLSASERARLERFAFDEDAWHYLVAHALLRRTLARCAPVAPEAWSFRAAPGGRPEIEAPKSARRLRFSLSHTRGLVACAVCLDHDVGVDAEAVDEARMTAELAERFLSPAEVESVERLPGERRLHRLFELWTLKEACLKARGDGLAVAPGDLSFRLRAGRPPAVSFAGALSGSPGAWRFAVESLASGHLVAVAVRCGASRRMRFLSRAEGG
jgi:4'-phosphopantetheinyl transferase